MNIENTEISRIKALPEGYSAEYDESFGGSLVIRENDDLVAADISGDEKRLFGEVFGKVEGIEIFNGWKMSQLEQEGGD